jgi:rod shape-determining protein MreC
MHYQRSKTRKERMKRLLPVLPLLMAVLLLGGAVAMPEGATSVARALATPFWTLRDGVSSYVAGAWGTMENRAALVAENEALREQLWVLERENYAATALTRDNEELRKLVGRIEAQPSLIAVAIRNDANTSPYDTFGIDRGEADGVRPDMLIISPEGVALGTVTTVDTKTARATRFSAPGALHDAVVQASSSLHIELMGIGAGTLRASVPRDLEVREGDIVVLPRFSSYPVGTVVSIEVAPEDAFQTLFVKSPVNHYTLRYGLLDPIATTRAVQVPAPDEPTPPDERDTE